MTASQQRLIDNIDTSGRAMLVVMDDLEDEEEENPYAELEPLRLVSLFGSILVSEMFVRWNLSKKANIVDTEIPVQKISASKKIL